MKFKRTIEDQLSKWKANELRKPLIIRGARQVGKTTLVNKFSKSYKYSIFLNLEKSIDISYFQQFDDVKIIADSLFLTYRIPSNEMSNTLLFIDEIQESPKAIQLLRYFHEELPHLHVIAAGSLLEFAMRKVKSFPVGRVEYLYLYPLNFQEYLEAIGHTQALEQLNTIPVKSFASNVLLDLFNKYAIIGGMPEVIHQFILKGGMADLPQIYKSIWSTYKNDVEKYAHNQTKRKVIKHIINTAQLYVDKRIKFENFGNSNYRSREVGEAMRNLDDAKIIQLIYPTTQVEIPVIPDLKKSPRLQFLDTGLLNFTIGIQAEMLALKDLNPAYKGAIIPHLITQEIMSLNVLVQQKPNFWVREKKQSTSEVDLVYSYRDKVIPIEIKSGKDGSLKSLHQFVEQANHPYAVRIYGAGFTIEKTKTPTEKPYILMNLPYFLGTKIPEYIAYFVENFKL
ncbi:MAG: AAA family ATPase [Salinivirgaceae bacterium]|nr:AAA family ATPase [Salinivirgaceae bacterium]